MTNYQLHQLVKEYQTNITDDRRNDILQLVFTHFSLYILKQTRNHKDQVQECHIAIHNVLSTWTSKSKYPLLQAFFTGIKWAASKEYAKHYQRPNKNRVPGDIVEIEKKAAGKRSSDGAYYKFHVRRMQNYFAQQEIEHTSIYDKELPPISERLKLYILENKTVIEIMEIERKQHRIRFEEILNNNSISETLKLFYFTSKTPQQIKKATGYKGDRYLMMRDIKAEVKKLMISNGLYFPEDRLYRNYGSYIHDEFIHDELLKEINTLRVAVGNSPLTKLQPIKQENYNPKKAGLLWHRKNPHKAHEYYLKAKAAGKYKEYNKRSQKRLKLKQKQLNEG